MELQVDLLDEINFRYVETQKAVSWETNDETPSNPPQICASECTFFPFAPEICTESLLPNRDKITARIVKNESDLVMDFAFLLCGWESRSILIHNDTFSLRYKLSLPGVSHSIIENICSSLAETAKDVLLLERNCGGSIMKNSPIYLAFCRSMMETIRLHRTLVLKLGTVKSLPLFVKMTRRCCGGIRFISRVYNGLDFKKNDIHMILSLLAFSPYAHGEFEKKLLAFLLKSCTKPYLNFIKNIMRGVIVDNQVEDFCGTPVSVNKDVNAATGGISDVLIELHKAVLQSIRNGKILHSDKMKEAISENIKRAQIINNQLERKMLSTRKMLEKEKKSPDQKKKKPPADLLQHHPPPEEISSKFGPLSSRSMELKEVDTTKLSASLGLELEVFYKELQSRLKSQYDLEDWRQRRAKMALKRRGLRSSSSEAIITEEVDSDNEDQIEQENNESRPETSLDIHDSGTENAEVDEKGETSIEEPSNLDAAEVSHELPIESKNDQDTLEKSDNNEIINKKDADKKTPPKVVIQPQIDKLPKKSAKKSLTFGQNVPKTIPTETKSVEIPSSAEPKDSVMYGFLLRTPKEPESDFLTTVLPLKSSLQDLNSSSLKVILGGMRFFDHISTIKKLLFFQNRSILEQICTLFHEPMGATWKISTIIDFVSRDPQVDPLLLKNVILKPYKGVIMDLSLSYGVEWPMTLTISNNAMELMEKSSGFLLEIELVKWKLNQLYKELLTSKSDYPVKIHLMIHQYVLFSSRLAAYAYAQIHDECWPVFDKRIGIAVTSGKTIDDCGQITGRLFKNIATRFFLEKRAAKIHETIVGILKNTSEYVGVIQNMKNETDHVALSRAFKKFHDFQALKKFLLKVLRAIHPNGCQWFDDINKE